jgi:hypothetical protein
VSGPEQQADGDSEVTLGLIAAPGLPAELVPAITTDLGDELARRFPAVRWRIVSLVDPLVQPPADDGEIVRAARQRLLERNWNLAITLTDLPLQLARRPVVAHGSPVHSVGVISVPALGVLTVRRRAVPVAVQLIEGLLGEPTGGRQPDQAARTRRLRRRATQLSHHVQTQPQQNELRYTARVLTGNLRLVLGMIRANRPWRLAVGLTRALTAALAAGVFALVTPDIWRLANAFGTLRLTGIGLLAILATAVTLVIGAHLWERPPTAQVREQVALFNLATTATVVIGVLTFYAVLFGLATAAALVLVVPDLLATTIGQPAGVRAYLNLAWLTTSLATIGGALGAGLESDESVRQAAYSYRPSTDLQQQ